MKTFVLLGIDKYRHGRLICIVHAPNAQDAARRLGGAANDAHVVRDRSPTRLHFDLGADCATFVPGECTDEVLAAVTCRDKDAPGAMERLIAYYRYGTENVYREYLLGTLPEVR